MNERYNLSGWLRDVRSCLDSPDDRGLTMLTQLKDLLEEVVDGGDECIDDGPDADELEPEDADDDVVMRQPGVGVRARAERRRLGAGRQGNVGGSAPVADVLPRDVPEARKRSTGRSTPVARAKPAVKKGGSRGKK